MAYEHSTPENDLIGRRKALATFAGITTAVAGVTLLGEATARAADEVSGEVPEATSTTVTDNNRTASTVAAEQQRIEAVDPHQLAMIEALIPSDLDVGAWKIEKVQLPRLGAIAVVMRSPAGEAFQVDVLKRDPRTTGVADTKHFSVFVANGGNGSHETDEWQARGAKVLAHHIRRTERSGAPLPQLMTFSERASRHPFGSFGALG